MAGQVGKEEHRLYRSTQTNAYENRMSGTSGIVVWEWKYSSPVWVPFPPKVCKHIENEFQRSASHGKVFLQDEIELIGWEIHFSKMKQVNPLTNEYKLVRRQQYPSSTSFANGVYWKWCADYRWQRYDVETSNYIEDAYKKKNSTVDLQKSPIKIPNILDFSCYKQLNKHTKFQREVCRETTTEKYPDSCVNTDIQASSSSQLTPISTQLSESSVTQSNRKRSTPYSSTNSVKVKATSVSPNKVQSGHSSHQSLRPINKPVEEKQFLKARAKQNQVLSGPLANFARFAENDFIHDEECAICMESLCNTTEGKEAHAPLELLKCKHQFHMACLQRLNDSGIAQHGCLRCPICNTIHGVMKGNQPAGGTMNVTVNNKAIPGYPNCGSILIVYNFTSGTQGQNHPHPGQRYHANSFPRTCYLPSNEKGKRVLTLLKIAFERQLVFTVATSVTTGQEDSVVWNDIHHKTEGYGNNSGYGYPDPNYLDNVLKELASHGVTDTT